MGDIFSMVSGGAGVISDIFNIGSQIDNTAYQRNLQQIMFNREDNAVQRRVADLKAAKLSPTLAAGSAAQAGPVVSTKAPESRIDQTLAAMTLLKQKADIARTAAETKVTESQAKKLDIETDFMQQMNPLNYIEKARTLETKIEQAQSNLRKSRTQEQKMKNELILQDLRKQLDETNIFLKKKYGESQAVADLMLKGAQTRATSTDTDWKNPKNWMSMISQGIGAVGDIMGMIKGK